MAKFISSICTALMALVFLAAAGVANADTKPCCYNSGEYFQSTPTTCNRYGGRVVPFEYCQRAYYQPWQNNGQNYSYGDKPCCYNDGRFYHSTTKNCRKFGGRVVALDYCRRNYNQPWGDGYNQNYGYPYNNQNSNDKPCCYNNGQYFQSTPSTCRKYGGYTVPYEYCTGRRY